MMGVSIPDEYDITLSGGINTTLGGSLGSVGPVTLAGIPDTFHIHVEKLPKIQLGVDPITIQPLTLNIALKEVPSMRTHLPADFSVGLSLLGMELFCVRLCGEAQVINEPYRPNPCERCGPSITTELPPAVPVTPASGQPPG
jgi:hypothetical protein